MAREGKRQLAPEREESGRLTTSPEYVVPSFATAFLLTSRTLVMRKDAVLSLILNAPLFKGMHCTIGQDPRYVRFAAIESGAMVQYNLRCNNAPAAEELQKAISAWTPGNDDALARWKKQRKIQAMVPQGRR